MRGTDLIVSHLPGHPDNFNSPLGSCTSKDNAKSEFLQSCAGSHRGVPSLNFRSVASLILDTSIEMRDS